ncbi:recombination protein RecR [Gluconacetobacter sacchari DSM 12717]|uniref:Recombination protein RecR n=2 Tax=Gluconacetobacter sacchari TaxID=92759 RepID=A0A7W4IB91_9PROT|nr:recombination mediator RecR [Gluconacetobacter sacchari]MBB2159638.1 recombination protein RecR [Gluconacetobacter sacchari]GBQ25168.1 recombination protein RecR [Gluconacetobacter sacchari DSM 12717]
MGGADIERLIALLARLPGLGPRSARRAALALLRQPQARMLPLAQAMEQAARSVRTCSTCGNLDTRDPCAICTDPGRDRGVVCVVETVGDLWALERAGVHRGVYQVLGGTLSALAGTGPDDLNLAPLLARLEAGGVREVILALGATVEGAATTHWLQDRLVGFDVPVSRVGQGLPMGGALDVLDDGTLAAALTARKIHS